MTCLGFSIKSFRMAYSVRVSFTACPWTVRENVSVSSGTLKLEGHGNLYTGDVQGCNKNLPGGIRTGAAIATRDYYASGCYEVVAKVAPVFGACSAIWTLEYE